MTSTLTSSRFETLDAVVNKNGTIIMSSALGKVNVNCKLRCGFPGPHAPAALSVVPPDGRFTLIKYRFDPSASKPGAAPALTAAAAAQLQVHVPFTPGASLSITDHGGALEDIAVELYLGSSATGAICSGEWTFASGPGRTAMLWFSFASGDAHPRPARAAQISFVLPAGALLSALKIDQLELSGETYTPYKGVRGRALGRVEW
ncbi:hypothetical protein EDB84DRAFT_1562721 [Lactarius hengduanensis]|nr:hypothetical protein EDB84DRAFT_1562721 [Lactarius hengduanensis]